jgi:hypothetical protein
MPRTTTMSTSRLPASFGARTHVSLSVARTPTGRRLLVHVRNGNGFAISGVLRSKRAALSPRAFRVPAATATTLRVVLPAPLRRKLERQGAVRLQVDALVRDPAGHTRAVTADARVRLARPSRR